MPHQRISWVPAHVPVVEYLGPQKGLRVFLDQDTAARLWLRTRQTVFRLCCTNRVAASADTLVLGILRLLHYQLLIGKVAGPWARDHAAKLLWTFRWCYSVQSLSCVAISSSASTRVTLTLVGENRWQALFRPRISGECMLEFTSL